jgi:hypothetical protein
VSLEHTGGSLKDENQIKDENSFHDAGFVEHVARDTLEDWLVSILLIMI